MVWEFPSCSESAHIAVKPCYLDRIAFLFGDNYPKNKENLTRSVKQSSKS